MSDSKLNNRIGTLDLVKIIATLLIVFHHYGQFTENAFLSCVFWNKEFYFGNVVELFFMISGLMIVHSIHQFNFSSFIIGKIIRLYPMAVISTIVVIVLEIIYKCICGMWLFDYVISTWPVVKSIFLINTGGVLSSDFYANNPLWYIGELMICYCIYYFVSWCSDKCSVSRIYGFIIMTFIGNIILNNPSELPLLDWRSGRAYSCFFWGCFLYYIIGYIQNRAQKRRVNIFLATIGAIILFEIADMFIFKIGVYDGYDTLRYIIYSGILILSVCCNDKARFLNNKYIKWFGEISYEVYIWYFPALVLILKLCPYLGYKPLNNYCGMLLFSFFIFSLGCGMHLIEKKLKGMLSMKINEMRL